MKELISKFYSETIITNIVQIRTIIFTSLFTSIIYLISNGGWEKFPDSYDYTQGIDAVLKNEDWYDYKIAFYPGVVFFFFAFCTIF